MFRSKEVGLHPAGLRRTLAVRLAEAAALMVLFLLARPALAQMTLTGSVSPSQVSYVGTLTYTANAGGGDPGTTQYAFFRRRPGGTWIPDINAPTWQSSNVYGWHPSLSDVGTWETYIWVKDGNTPSNANTYGYAAGYNTMPIEVFGPPSTPGPTTVSCAYSVSDECWVTGDFVASAGASTGGLGSISYQICRSNDTTGWGGCDVNLTLSGGTSYTVSGSQLPADGYRRAYYFRAGDSAGAWSGFNTPVFVRVDRYAPSVGASNASATWYSYRVATVSASDSGSGVQSVRYNWNAPLDGNCSTGTATSSGATLVAPNGDNTLYLCARDNTGRVGQWSGQYRVSPMSLTGSVSPSQASYLGSFTWTMSASGGTPGTTQYAFFRRPPGGTWVPSVYSPQWQSSNVYTWRPSQSDVGTWETYVWVKDGSTPPDANGYGYAAGFNTMPVTVVGPPSTPGPTAVACAWWAASTADCWVAGNFTVSAAASTGGTGSLVYQICRSNDVTGWGGCDVNLTLAGGTSLAVSGADLPADGYRRAYYFRAGDSAGAWSGFNTPVFVRVDRYAPAVSASNASDSWFPSSTATVSASDATGGAGANSGLLEVRYRWNAALDANCTTGTVTSSGAALTAPAGDNLLYLCARDNVQRVTQWNGRYRVSAPLSLTGSIAPGQASYLNTFTYTANASGGDPATIRYAFFRRRPGGTWIPDVNNPAWSASNTFTWAPTQSDVGSWETYIWVKDAYTPPTQNTYGYAAGFNTMPVTVVGPPTAPGPTTAACAYSVPSTADCWVTGDFTVSAAASTGGTGSLVYQICRSNDSAGGWAGCDVNLTLSGGTSTVVSTADLPSDGYRRAYYFQARDSAGALSGWNTPAFVRVDRYAPAVSASNASDNWSSGLTATVSASDVTGGAGANSGLLEVRYRWNSALDANCTTGTVTTPGAALTAPAGDNLLYLCARDNVQRVTQWSGRYRVSAPTTLTVTPPPARSSYLTPLTFTATATGGDPSTRQFAFVRRHPGGAWIPDPGAAVWQSSNVLTWRPTLADVGNWEFYFGVRDATTPPDMNGYGYAAGYALSGPFEVVGPPTVPGATAMTCDYTAPSGDCWVNGENDVAAGVTPSTGGMGSLVYQICRSNDAAGLGGCQVNLTLNGGTSIVIPAGDLPADGVRQAYYFQARDSAGAVSGWSAPGYLRVDRNGPELDVTNSSDEWFTSRTATVTATDDWGGAAANSGLRDLRYSWNAEFGEGCAGGTALASGTTLTAPEGDNLLWVCVRDNVGWTVVGGGRYRVNGSAALTLTGTVTPAKASYPATFTYTATASGGDASTWRFAFFRRRPGGTWIPDVHNPAWQASNVFTWSPNEDETGTWETYIWVKDGSTPPDASGGYGYAAGFNTGPIEVLPRLAVTSTPSPSQAPYGTPITWTATATGGIPETTRFAFFRRHPGGDWIPDVHNPAWQTGNQLTWTPEAADLGTWETYIWVKDGSTPPAANGGYGYAAGTNPGPVEIVAPPPSDFQIGLTPSAATVARGASAQFTVSLTADAGFTDTAVLSVGVTPQGTTQTLQPAAIGAGGTATLTVATTNGTPLDTYQVDVTATAGGQTRGAAAQVRVVSPQAPVLNRITPDSFINGGRVHVTVEGSFLSGATVSIAQEQTDPSNPKSRVFPTARVVSINPAGTSMEVEIDATDTRILDFHNLVVDNGTAREAIPFRVLPGGPLPDAWTPSQPEVGLLHALSIAGRNLAGATLTPSVGGRIRLYSVETSDTEITALLEVLPNAPTGPMKLIISDGAGRTAEVAITIVLPAKSALRMHNLTESGDGKSVAQGFHRRPAVWFQEFVVRDPDGTEVLPSGRLRARGIDHEEIAKRLRAPKSISFDFYIHVTIPLVRVQWQKVILFDPVTGAIGDAVLQGLGIGTQVPIGAFVISAYFEMDLTIYFRATNFGFTFPLFCIEISYGVEVTGFDGFAYHTSFCVGGGWYARGKGSVENGELTGGDCASVTPTGLDNGMLEGTVEQNACCSQPIGARMSGHTFGRLPWGKSFSIDSPQAGTTTSDQASCPCPCTVSLGGTVVTPGGSTSGNVNLKNASSGPCTYQYEVRQGSGQTQMDLANSQGTLTVGANETVSQRFDVSFPGGRPAPDVATLKVVVQSVDSESNSQPACQATKASCVYPAGETSRFAGWSSNSGWDAARFFGDLTPADTSFAGRKVTEGQPNSGTGSFDNCWFPGSAIPDYRTANLTGGIWNIIAGNTYDDADLIGFKVDFDGYYKAHGRVPCSAGTNQTMYIYCGPSTGPGPFLLKNYTTNRFLIEATPNGTKVTRGSAVSTTLH